MLAFVLTLEDPYHFEMSRSVGAYLGLLVPARDLSGDRDPRIEFLRGTSPRKVPWCSQRRPGPNQTEW